MKAEAGVAAGDHELRNNRSDWALMLLLRLRSNTDHRL